MNQWKETLKWAKQYLVSEQNTTILSVQKIVNTSYSMVHRIVTTMSTVYLKQTPKMLFLEPKTLAFLHQMGCKSIPTLIAENDAFYCFLMTGCGDESLRYLFKSHMDIQSLKQGISNFTKIQRLLENQVTVLQSLKLPDWRLEHFPLLYSRLIEQEQLLMKDGLTKKEVDHLHQLYPTCITLCENLAAYDIPETLNHCDFYENNMLLDRKTGTINIIDWGETVITHPFFSLCGCLWNLTYFQRLQQTDPIYLQLQSHCIAAWRDIYDEVTLLQAFSIATQLSGIFAALGYERMYLATQDQTKTVQREHNGAIAGCLRTFISCNP